MSKRLNLREFQQSLSDRMNAKNRSSGLVSTLGVQIADQNWLVEMTDISEVLPLPQLTTVPQSKAWFRGVTNVRGNLYCVADMAAYFGKGEVSGDISNRVLLVSGRYAFNAALLVDHVLGLRDARAWTPVEEQGAYRDHQGDVWRKLDIVGLLKRPDFLQVAI